ncbi:MAG: HAD-IIIA family hydrolase [Candidatus Omnitrophica bacterium]|nr:HAD-IIIA family hydrolase [Candidatus Omnitrophota bacterium]
MKVIFLDRDGVINEFPGNGKYVTKIKEFHFIPGSIEAIKKLTDQDYKIFIISNQAGVGKGVFSKAKLESINNHMLKYVTKAGGKIKRSFYCTHRSDAGCDCRKPQIGNLKRAFSLVKGSIRSAKKTFFVGDTEADIRTGYNAGCRTIFVLSGREDRRYMRKWEVKPDFIVKNLKKAVEVIEHENSNHSRNGRRRT